MRSLIAISELLSVASSYYEVETASMVAIS